MDCNSSLGRMVVVIVSLSNTSTGSIAVQCTTFKSTLLKRTSSLSSSTTSGCLLTGVRVGLGTRTQSPQISLPCQHRGFIRNKGCISGHFNSSHSFWGHCPFSVFWSEDRQFPNIPICCKTSSRVLGTSDMPWPLFQLGKLAVNVYSLYCLHRPDTLGGCNTIDI